LQAKLLRVLQEGEFERIGNPKTIKVDVRVIAATNRELAKEIGQGNFREDLYYRLNVFPIRVPPLRERKEDIPLLAHYFLNIYSTKMGKKIEGIPKSEMDKLRQYDWPGNVRELANLIERSTILTSESLLRVPELSIRQGAIPYPQANLTLKENERRHILWALHKTGWKVRGRGGAAELLDIPASTLAFRMKKLGIQKPPRLFPPGEDFQPGDF